MKLPGITLVVVLALHVPGTVRAAADGGIQSVFAYGAGNRALSMGGAFAAVADDATAPFWNPSGLGWVPKFELQGGHAALYGLDIQETYATLAYPSWSWGVAALSFRNFGVGGIEGRDDRNLVTDPDLSDRQTEIALSYGRRMGAAWSLGASVKMRRHELAGVSGSGVGLDLGLMVKPGIAFGATDPWAEGLNLGLTLHNAVEPAIRLETDEVADPMAIRAGASYQHRFAWGGSFLAAVDVDKPRDLDPRLHAGLEVRVHPLLALRGGLGAQSFTAGAGVTWQDIALDYVFEENDIDAVHRIGLSLRFGASVEERRLAAIREREEAIQARLADAFDRREDERARSLLADAESAIREGRFQDALQLTAVAGAIAADSTRTTDLEVRAWRGEAEQFEAGQEFAEAVLAYQRAFERAPHDSTLLEAAERCRTEGDRRAERTAQLRDRFARALDAFGSGGWIMARDGFQGILAEDPTDAEAREMLARTKVALDRRAQELADQGERLLAAGLLGETEQILAEARKLAPDSPRNARLAESLAQAQRRAATPAPVRAQAPQPDRAAVAETAATPAPRRGPTPEERAEADGFYQRGIKAMEADRLDEAIRFWELAIALDPGHAKVREYLKREYIMRGMDAFAAGLLEDAVDVWEKALQVDPTDSKAQGYLARAREQMVRTREILGSGR